MVRTALPPFSPGASAPFPSLAAGARVRFQPEPLGRSAREYLRSVAEDVNLGGMFIATPHTFREGTPLQLELDSRERDGFPIRAKAVVCWRRRWLKPYGMAVRFVELDSLQGRSPESCLETLLES